MRPNLETLREEIERDLESRGIAVFYGVPRADEMSSVYWDTERTPDHRLFLRAVEVAGVKLVTLYVNRFTADMLDDAMERLDESAAGRDDRRALEQRLRELRAFEGFLCQIELSFELGQRTYIFDLRTEWYEDFDDLIDRIESSFGADDDGEPLGGYFSKN
jgi:hypothetical protein